MKKPAPPSWNEGTGAYAESSSCAATANNINAAINYVDPLICAVWLVWRLLRHGDALAGIWIPANKDLSVRDVQAEWRRLHVPSHPLYMTNTGMLLLVPTKQRRWAEYVLRRHLAGRSVPAWGEYRKIG